MGLIFTTISEQGLGALVEYGRLIVILVGSMAVVAFIVNPLVTFVCTKKKSISACIYMLKKKALSLRSSQRSSAANIPVNMELCKKT